MTRIQTTLYAHFGKRSFDLTFALIGLVVFSWVILIAVAVASADTQSFGFFRQLRVGKDGRLFTIFKIKTMRDFEDNTTTVTTASDPRLTRSGRMFRKFKIDELPQLVNVAFGQMSFVGPRPDVPGWADTLTGDDRIVLGLRPGITGPATLHFRNEEEILDEVDDPEAYNAEVIFPMKTALNRQYAQTFTFIDDLRYIVQTLTPGNGPKL